MSAARGGRRVLDGIDLSLADGEVTALLGPSGSGKSSLLRLLNRLADPDEGTVRFHGEDVRGLDPLDLRRRAVLVPQLPAPLPGTVAENLSFGPRLAGRDVPEVVRCLARSGLGDEYAERDASRLSVGEGQRVMLARALALEPEALLLDEPTSALDDDAREGIERTLGEIGLPMVLVTHDRAQAARLAGRIVEIEKGRLA